jgi:hypothetical protein
LPDLPVQAVSSGSDEKQNTFWVKLSIDRKKGAREIKEKQLKFVVKKSYLLRMRFGYRTG